MSKVSYLETQRCLKKNYGLTNAHFYLNKAKLEFIMKTAQIGASFRPVWMLAWSQYTSHGPIAEPMESSICHFCDVKVFRGTQSVIALAIFPRGVWILIFE